LTARDFSPKWLTFYTNLKRFSKILKILFEEEDDMKGIEKDLPSSGSMIMEIDRWWMEEHETSLRGTGTYNTKWQLDYTARCCKSFLIWPTFDDDEREE